MVNAAIAERLEALGLSQADLARELHVRPQTVNKWLSGENTPPPSRWRAIEEALGFEAGYLARVAGLIPADPDRRQIDTIEAIRSDPRLEPDQREDLVVLYRHFLARNRR